MSLPILLTSVAGLPVVVERRSPILILTGFAKGYAGTIYWDDYGKAFAVRHRRHPQLDLGPAAMAKTTDPKAR
jgi:hypothetical protein